MSVSCSKLPSNISTMVQTSREIFFLSKNCYETNAFIKSNINNVKIVWSTNSDNTKELHCPKSAYFRNKLKKTNHLHSTANISKVLKYNCHLKIFCVNFSTNDIQRRPLYYRQYLKFSEIVKFREKGSSNTIRPSEFLNQTVKCTEWVRTITVYRRFRWSFAKCNVICGYVLGSY